jgi:transcriptional regulator with XRE-family HTH domain
MKNMEIGIAVKSLREGKELSQVELATKAGITQASLSQIELNKTFPSKNNLKKLAGALDIHPRILVLLGSTEKEVPDSKKESFREQFPKIKDLLIELYSSDKAGDLSDLTL